MWPHFSRLLVEGIVWASVGIGVALDQGRTGILDLLVWGAQMNVDLSGYPSDIRAEAEAAALAYVTDLRPCYEWEGYSDCPAREAAFAADYRAAHPAGPFSQFLPLLEAHRWLCAAEGFDYEKNVNGASTARTRYRAALSAASASNDRLVRIGATELQVRGTCINVSRE